MKTSEAAIGKWFGILRGLGVPDTFLRNRHGPCPMCGGADRFRFDDKEGRGTWYCNQCGSGDGIDLALKFTGREFKGLAKEIDSMVGNIQANEKPAEKDPAERLRKVQQGSAIVKQGDDVHTYLAGRGLEVPKFGIRIHPCLPYWSDGQLAGHYTAMLGTFCNRAGKPITYHVTYLSKGDKAPVRPCRKILPSTEKMHGGAIRLSPVADHLGIAEGIETALAASILHGVPTWAATSASLLETFTPPEGVSTVTIFSDNDRNFTGQASAYTLANRLSVLGLTVRVFVPTFTGTDYCDVLKLVTGENKNEP